MVRSRSDLKAALIAVVHPTDPIYWQRLDAIMAAEELLGIKFPSRVADHCETPVQIVEAAMRITADRPSIAATAATKPRQRMGD